MWGEWTARSRLPAGPAEAAGAHGSNMAAHTYTDTAFIQSTHSLSKSATREQGWWHQKGQTMAITPWQLLTIK